MSSFKNIKPHRKYRQRAQPEARQRLGLLEKKKDYKQRAKNYHEKEDKLKQLKLKASLKNEDQFYFRMEKSKMKDGKHMEFDSDESDIDEKQYKRELKTENYKIVTMQRAMDENKINKLKSQLHLIEAPKVNKHTIFVDSKAQLNKFDLADYYDTVPEMLDNKSNILTKKQLQQSELQTDLVNSKAKENYKKLLDTIDKQSKMKKMMLKISYQKNLLTKERKKIKKFKGQTCHKFFMERKK